MKLREKVYIYSTWLTPLLAGESSCQWKIWMKAHYQGLETLPSNFDSAKWNEEHTALLSKLRDKYERTSKKILMEGQTSWKINGKTATLAGKMDLVTVGPNLVIDAKSGKPKNSHALQVQIYLLAIQFGAVPGLSGEFTGVLEYPTHSVDVPFPNGNFAERLWALVRRIAEPSDKSVDLVPSYNECRFCDLKDCESRATTESGGVETSLF